MYFIAFLGAVAFASLLGSFGLALLFADAREADACASRTETFVDAVMGRVRTRDDCFPDSRIRRGMVYNGRRNRIEVCARLSDESLDRVFRPRRRRRP